MIDSVLTTLLNVVGSVKAIYKYTKDLEYFATRDPLTDLFNQRVFWELLYYEMERSKRHDYKFSLVVIDIDNSGFSSYQYIKRFPIDFVKVEGEFIRGMASGKETDRAIVMSIATLAKGLGIKTVAEYVEDGEVLKAVEAVGMDYAQGFYIGRPSPDFKF